MVQSFVGFGFERKRLMEKIKKLIVTLAAISLAAAAVSCNDSGKTEKKEDKLDSVTREELASIAAQDPRLTGELENKTIKWMANWGFSTDSHIDLVVFQERYGGNIEETIIDWEVRYEKLATAINGDEGIDFFPAGDADVFPKGAIKSMFAPVDEYVDFSSELWKDVKNANDMFVWDGKHYLLCTNLSGGNTAVFYNKKTIEEYGLDDPQELFENNNWTWDTFKKILDDFVDPENGLYGIDGYWTEAALSLTTGVPYVGLENGKLVNNLKDPALERVQNFMAELYKDGCVIDKSMFDWSEMPSFIGEGKELFYPCGLWAIYKYPEEWQKTLGKDAFFVPMPKDPKADKYYIPTTAEGYMMVSGGHNPEGVAKFAECKRAVMLNEGLNGIGDELLIKTYGWTPEMIAMRDKMWDMANENPVFDFYAGVSADITGTLDSAETGIRASLQGGVSWAETVGSCYSVIDALIEDANNGLA